MNQKNIDNLRSRVESELLSRVRRPARYIGGEVNQVKKDIGLRTIQNDMYYILLSGKGAKGLRYFKAYQGTLPDILPPHSVIQHQRTLPDDKKTGNCTNMRCNV